MPAFDYEYNGSTIAMPFDVGDRVVWNGTAGTVASYNHDDLDDIKFFVSFDGPVGTFTDRYGNERATSNELVSASELRHA